MFGADMNGIEAQGEVALNGVKQPAASFDSRVEVMATLRLTDQSLGLTGTLHVVQTSAAYSSCGIPYSFDAQIVTASRVALDESAASYGGIWRGTYVVQSCTKIGWLNCWPEIAGEPYTFYLELTQNGSSVTGRVALAHPPVTSSGCCDYDIAVTGTVAGGLLVLQGSWTSADGRNTTRLLTFGATRDMLGRMNGSLSYVSDFQVSTGLNSSTYDATLVSVTLDPTS
jgi:hypothetical protein